MQLRNYPLLLGRQRQYSGYSRYLHWYLYQGILSTPVEYREPVVAICTDLNNDLVEIDTRTRRQFIKDKIGSRCHSQRSVDL